MPRDASTAQQYRETVEALEDAWRAAAQKEE